MPQFSDRPRFGLPARGLALFTLALTCSALPACGDDDDGNDGPTNTGQACASVDQCYPGIMQDTLEGEAECLDRVEGGYCTHHCTQDSDCCAVPGECPDNHAQVCGPFESTGEMYCFLSCEDADLEAAKLSDGDQYCQTYASAAFHCRSTGGGSENRKVCLP
jgi:hypothetical protein